MAWRKICPRKKLREKDKKSINILGDSNIFPNFAGSKGLFLFFEKRAAIRVILINSYNWYYTMFSLKTRKTYQSPCTKVAEVDLEGLVCTSGFKRLQVDELHNMNIDDDATGANSEHYFEF